MKFSQYFQAWLNEGYYKNAVKVGKEGDFYTAVSVGELFGSLLANHLLKLVESGRLTPPFSVVEVGANEGFLMKDLQAYLPLKLINELNFYIIEPHKALQTVQKQTLKDCKVKILSSLSDFKAKSAFFYANELFDCFAPELILENKLCFVEDNKLVFKPCEDKILEEARKCQLLKAEISPFLAPFLDLLKSKVEKRLIFACFDYFAKGKIDDFSIRIFKNHQVYDPFKVDLKEFYAKSDITYNVDLTYFKHCLNTQGFKLYEDLKQSQALISFGLHEVVDKAEDKNKFLLQAKNLIFGFDDKFRFLEFGF